MLKQLLLRLFSNEEISNEFIKRYSDDVFADNFTPEQAELVFADMASIEKIQDLFKSMLKKDRIQFFNAPKEAQEQIRGAFLRTLWILKSLRERKKPEVKQKLQSPFHG